MGAHARAALSGVGRRTGCKHGWTYAASSDRAAWPTRVNPAKPRAPRRSQVPQPASQRARSPLNTPVSELAGAAHTWLDAAAAAGDVRAPRTHSLRRMVSRG